MTYVETIKTEKVYFHQGFQVKKCEPAATGAMRGKIYMCWNRTKPKKGCFKRGKQIK